MEVDSNKLEYSTRRRLIYSMDTAVHSNLAYSFVSVSNSFFRNSRPTKTPFTLLLTVMANILQFPRLLSLSARSVRNRMCVYVCVYRKVLYVDESVEGTIDRSTNAWQNSIITSIRFSVYQHEIIFFRGLQCRGIPKICSSLYPTPPSGSSLSSCIVHDANSCKGFTRVGDSRISTAII